MAFRPRVFETRVSANSTMAGCCGGKGGIRTHDRFLGGSRFQGECDQPLRHPSSFIKLAEAKGFEPPTVLPATTFQVA
jgi:hypothetical protein